MTICISAVCRNSTDNCIIMASDRMLSMGGYTSADGCTVKVDPLYYHWFSQFAADNVPAVLPIYDGIANTEETGIRQNVVSVANLCKSAYKSHRWERIEDEVLSSYGLTWDELKAVGKQRLSDRDLQIVTEKIRSFDLNVELLISGFDDNYEPHIFTVENPGTTNYYDKLGFWAIGSGQPNALASLFSSRYKTTASMEACVSQVLSAKFAAESAQGVGETTFLFAYTGKDQILFLSNSIEKKIRREWEKIPRFPTRQLVSIRENLLASIIHGPQSPGFKPESFIIPMPSISQTSADQQ